MSNMNRMGVAKNPYQGNFKRVLCVCSGGVLRSPTAARVLGNYPYVCNTRAAGLDREFALIWADDTLLYWAEEIVCMEKAHQRNLETRLRKLKFEKPIICLDIPDNFEYLDPKLIHLINEKYSAYCNL